MPATDGLLFNHMAMKNVIVECDMALAMGRMTEILSKKDVEEIGIFSLHRPESLYSFHSKGVALDINYLFAC